MERLKALKYISRYAILRGGFCMLLYFLSPDQAFAQSEPVVTSEIDTTMIRIGEQIRYEITIEADTSAVVFFPEGQTFSPMETVEAFLTDTTLQPVRQTAGGY